MRGLAPPFAALDTAYAGAWAYPAALMRRFVASPDWMPSLRDTVRGPGLRERAAFGWASSRQPSVTAVDEGCSLCVLHLGKSGAYYPGNVRGHNVLPMQSLVTRVAAMVAAGPAGLTATSHTSSPSGSRRVAAAARPAHAEPDGGASHSHTSSHLSIAAARHKTTSRAHPRAHAE